MAPRHPPSRARRSARASARYRTPPRWGAHYRARCIADGQSGMINGEGVRSEGRFTGESSGWYASPWWPSRWRRWRRWSVALPRLLTSSLNACVWVCPCTIAYMWVSLWRHAVMYVDHTPPGRDVTRGSVSRKVAPTDDRRRRRWWRSVMVVVM